MTHILPLALAAVAVVAAGCTFRSDARAPGRPPSAGCGVRQDDCAPARAPVAPEGTGSGRRGFAGPAVPARTQAPPGETARAVPPAGTVGALPPTAVRRISVLLAAKAARTTEQRKIGSQLLAAASAADGPVAVGPPSAGDLFRVADPPDDRVLVDIRADVTPPVLARVRHLGGTVVDSVPRHRAVRARLPLAAIEPLAALTPIQSIRTADEALTRTRPQRFAGGPHRSDARSQAATRRVDTTAGDVAHRADMARRTHGVDGIGIGIGVLSDGVGTLAERQATGDVAARVTVLPGQEGGPLGPVFFRSTGREGTAMLEIVHDLAPGAELFFATGGGGEARMAQNIEDLCTAGADVIVDDVGYLLAPAFQDGIIAQAIRAATADGCFHFSAAGNSGNLNDGTAGVWEGDFAAGPALVLNGVSPGAAFHDFGGGVTGNRIVRDSRHAFSLQWSDPWGASANDYDLFLIDAAGHVLDSSTNTQDGTQDPLEYIAVSSFFRDHTDARVVIVKHAGAADRYLRLAYTRGELAIATDGQISGHAASQQAVGVAAVDVRTAAGAGGVFDGAESVETFSSDGPRRIFFEADGTPITPGNFSSTGGRVLQKPDLTAADAVATSTPGFSTFRGTSAAAPHAGAIAALMLEAAGGPARVTLAALRASMTGAALDIEATGPDRDSGAGIVMAPGAVAAVAVEVADRNRPPVATVPAEQTLSPGARVTLDMAGIFTEPDSNALRYDWLPGDAAVVSGAVAGTSLTLDALAPGRTAVTVRAIDPDGLSAAAEVVVTVQVGSRDHDADDDGLIEVGTLAQLDALRHDLDGDGAVDGRPAADWRDYYAAFTEAAWGMGCPDGCLGYELVADLDFDTDASGGAGPGDEYWNAGAGWAPVGTRDAAFEAAFAGNGRALANLFIDRPAEDAVGLFGCVDGDRGIRDVGLVNVDVTGRDRVGSLAGCVRAGKVERGRATGSVLGEADVGGLVGWTSAAVVHSYAAVRVIGIEAVGGLVGTQEAGTIGASYATGPVSGQEAVGGLAGNSFDLIRASYATGAVSGQGRRLDFVWWCFETGGVGGLVGNTCGEIEASYATGAVSGRTQAGGLVGSVGTRAVIRSGYWDVATSGMHVGVGSNDADDNGLIDGAEQDMAGVAGLTTAALQAPTGYDGIYAAWNLDLDDDGAADDPWDFGSAGQYPAVSADLDDDGEATWQEFGLQLRAGPMLTATADAAQVVLRWTAVDTRPWTPAPDVTYILTRRTGATVEVLAEGLTRLAYIDTGVTPGITYDYQVAAVVTGGEAVRSAVTEVIRDDDGGPPPPPPPPPCEFSVTPVHRDVLWTAGTTRVGVSTGTDCAWTAASESVFLTLTAGAAGTGSGTVTFTVAANAGRPRTGMLTIAGERVTVLQASSTEFADHPIERGVTPVKAIHFVELRARIDALRAAAGLAAFVWTDPTLTAGGPIRMAHLSDLRNALAEVYAAAGRPPLGDSGAAAAQNGTVIRAAHLMELRGRVAALE